MAQEVVMPRMGYDMEKATIVSWIKHEGDSVVANEVIAEIETDKAVIEFEAPASGLLLRIVCQAGATVAVGKPIAYIGDAGEELPDTEEPGIATSAPGRQVAAPAPNRREEDRQPVSPLARRLAAELRVDLSQVHGTGPRGRVTRDDVLTFHRDRTGRGDGATVAPVQTLPEAPPLGMQATMPRHGELAPRQPNAEGIIPIGKMGQAIARRTQATFNEAPHIYVTVRVDMTEAMIKRDELNRQLPVGQRNCSELGGDEKLAAGGEWVEMLSAPSTEEGCERHFALGPLRRTSAAAHFAADHQMA